MSVVPEGFIMNNETTFQRILHAGAGLVLLVPVLVIIVIPFIILDKTPGATPGSAIFGIIIITIPHVLILFAFRAMIVASKRGDRLKNIVYIASGIGLLFLGLMILDGAVAYARHIEMYVASILMFMCIGCDFSAAVMAFAARRLQPKKAGI
jgi:hypothetical protein